MLLSLNMCAHTCFVDAWITRKVLSTGSTPLTAHSERWRAKPGGRALLVRQCCTLGAMSRHLHSAVGNPYWVTYIFLTHFFLSVFHAFLDWWAAWWKKESVSLEKISNFAPWWAGTFMEQAARWYWWRRAGKGQGPLNLGSFFSNFAGKAL